MKNLITSNFNLMHSNKEWGKFDNRYQYSIDRNFDYYFFALKKGDYLRKYDVFHIFLHLDKSNIIQANKKIFFLQQDLKKHVNKKFFFYLILDTPNIKKEKNNFFKNYEKLSSKLKIFSKKNVEVTSFKDLNKKFFSTRNKKILSFPFEIDIISKFRKNIHKNLSNLEMKPYKLIILDCDNTLWSGVLDEKGINGIKYGERGAGKIFKKFKKKIKNLKRKGFLLSLSSKNNSEGVWETMKKRRMYLSQKDFIYPKVNWNEKFINITKTLKELNLRPEDTVFIDDNIVEINKVKKYIKNINVIHISKPQDTLNIIKADIRFQKKDILKEDKKKLNQYVIKSNSQKKQKRWSIFRIL